MASHQVVLWHDHDAAHDVDYEIVQIAEGEFELLVLCDGQLWLEEQSTDLDALIALATGLRADLHTAG